MATSPPLPVGTVPLGGDSQLAIRAIQDPSQRDRLVLDVRLERRSGAAFAPTAAGFRCGLVSADLLADEIRKVARRASELELWAPAEEPHGTQRGSRS
jgi:hypothetical protein